jgi:hypothetical protein
MGSEKSQQKCSPWAVQLPSYAKLWPGPESTEAGLEYGMGQGITCEQEIATRAQASLVRAGWVKAN